VAVVVAGLAIAAAAPSPAFATRLDFESDHGGILEGKGMGTGFTHIAKPETGTGYASDFLAIEDGLLRMTTRPGIQWKDANSLVNGLGIGVPAGAAVYTAQTTLIDPPAGTRRYEQGGLWIGDDQDNYAKFVLNSPPSKLRLEFTLELGGERAAIHRVAPPAGSSTSLRLLLRRDVRTRKLGAWYAAGAGPLVELGSIDVPANFGTADPGRAAQHAGIFATHRFATRPLTYLFDDFALLCHSVCDHPVPGDPGPGRIDLEDGGDGSSPWRGAPGQSRFSAAVRGPGRTSLARLRGGIVLRVRCSQACRARSKLGPVRGRSRPPAATRIRVRLAASPRAVRRLRRQTDQTGRRRVRRALRTIVVGPAGQRIRIVRPLIVTL
jgi:hypothetical protein